MYCVIIDDSLVIRKQLEGFIKKTEELDCLGSYENPVTALNELTGSDKVDIIFLDVELPEMSGLELLDVLKTTPVIIIISGNEKYAINAFDYDVTDYILKPITYSRFYKSVERAVNKIKSGKIQEPESKKLSKEFFIKENEKFTKLHSDDIYFIKATGNYISVHTYNKRHIVHSTMKSIGNHLDDQTFVRVHRSFFININKISSITGNMIFIDLKDEQFRIPIGKIYKKELMDNINLMG